MCDISDCLSSRISRCNEVNWNTPQGGFFVRLRLPIVVDELLLGISAHNYGVIWTPMANFYPNAVKSHEIRLSCSYLTLEQIEEGTIRLAGFVKDTCNQ